MIKQLHRLVVIVVVALAGLTGWSEAPRIGVVYTTRMVPALESGARDGRQAYRAAVEAAGGVVVPLGQTHPPAVINERLKTLDGLLLPGGIDVDPTYYNEPEDDMLEETDASLDQFEFRLLDHAQRERLPVLGICRGHQLLNVYYGGSLIQDIPTQHVSEVEVVHRAPTRGMGWPEHDITVVADTILHDILGTQRVAVNTSHHQAVKRLAEGFVVSARTDDGIIEAIEHEGDVFILGVQWHPERMVEQDAGMRRLFERFITEARANMAP